MIDIYAQIENNVKQFVMKELAKAKKANNNPTINVLNCKAVAYGALQFASNYCFPCYNYDLAEWWVKEVCPEFQKLLQNRRFDKTLSH